MNEIVFDASPFAVAGLFCLVLASVAGIGCWRRLQSQQLQLQQAEARLETLERDALLQHGRVQTLVQRLMDCEAALQQAHTAVVANAAPVYRESSTADEFSAYNEATHWLEMGLTLEEIMRRSGLSRAEASLLETMWRRTPS